MLLLLLLICWGLLSQPLLYLSAFFEKHRERYFELLLAVSEEGKLGDWLLFFLEGITTQAQDAITRAKRLQDLQLDWHKRLTDRRVSSTLIRLADSIFDMPYLTIPDAQRLLGTSNYKTAQRNVVKLIDCGILQQFAGRDYGKLFFAQEILEIVEIKF